MKEEEESSPLLPGNTAGQEKPFTRSSPAPQENRGEGWACPCCCGAKPQARQGGQAPSLPLPLGSSCVKYLLFLSNLLFSLLALLALAAGLWGLAVKGSLASDWGGPLPTDPMLVLVLGGLAVSAVSLAGCLGALCENSCLLRGFCGVVLTCLALETLVGALMPALWGPLQDSLEHTLHAAITRYQDDPDLRFLLDQVQGGLQCCGAMSYQDWQQNLYFRCGSPGVQACSLPASCCIDPQEDGALVNTQCGFGALRLDEEAARQVVYLRGCQSAMLLWLRGHVGAVGGCVVSVIMIQATEVLWAAWLLRALAAREAAEDRTQRLALREPHRAQSRGNHKAPASAHQLGPTPA